LSEQGDFYYEREVLNLHGLWKWFLRPRGAKSGRDKIGSSGNYDFTNAATFADFLGSTGDVVSFYDQDFRLTNCSAAFKRLSSRSVVDRAEIEDFYPDYLVPTLRKKCDGIIGSGHSRTIELRTKAGEEHLSLLVFGAGNGIGVIERRQPDKSGSSKADEQERTKLLHQASHDVLTGLQNRRRFSERLQEVVASAGKSREKEALLQIDLDEFKNVNDTLGHGAGDTLLQLAASRIQGQLQDGETAYRYAGDEFAVIQCGKTQPVEAERLAGSIIQALKEPFIINGIPVFIGASIGVAFGPEHGTESEQLMKAADIALYAAKSDGRGCAKIFNRSMLLLLEQRENLRRSLRSALDRGELFLEYQPVFKSPSSLIGFEALLRWRHPEIGLIPPGVFIPIAEADGLMDQIGRWVLVEACSQAKTWPSTLAIAVNLSPAQFLSGKLTNTVAQVIDAVGIQAERLELEITESVLLEETVDNIDTLNTLNVLGIRISLDDFGTFYSSLSYLKNFPFDRLKVDQYFINDLETDRKSQAIVKSIISLAHGLGISVTAEGVETAGQASWLTEQGCDSLQGYFLGRPGDEDAARELIEFWMAKSMSADQGNIDAYDIRN
jgi:diguanylate cyclase (GGDEF)-like protein